MVDVSFRSSDSEKDVKKHADSVIERSVSPKVAACIDTRVDDDAFKYANTNVVLDKAMNRRLLRKADCYILTMMAFVYAIQFMDKISNTAAAVMGIIPDLKMTGNRYSWVGSSFYLGYLVFEIPISLVLQKFPLAKTTALFIVFWGVVLSCSAASQEYAGFISTRTLLGALEGAVTPSFLMITSQWYKREEQYSRVCFWFAWNGAGTIIGDAIAIGLVRHAKSYTMESWRILFIILGLMTVLTGFAFWFVIPNSPAEAWFLDETERAAQVERIRDNKQGYGNKQIKWDQVKETFIDPRTYLNFCIVLLSNIPNGGVTNFTTILYKGMNYDLNMIMLLGLYGGIVQLVGCSVTGVMSIFFFKNFRMVYASFGAIMTLVVLCILNWVPQPNGKSASIMLYSWVSPIAYIALLSCISSNSAGTTKKSLSSATLLIGYCVGNLVGPQIFKANEAPLFQTAKTTMVACAAVNVVLYHALMFLNLWENKRRDRKNEKLPDDLINSEFADLTDFQNPEFRYAM